MRTVVPVQADLTASDRIAAKCLNRPGGTLTWETYGLGTIEKCTRHKTNIRRELDQMARRFSGCRLPRREEANAHVQRPG